MTARVLVVDDIPANVKLLEARLTAEYFDVVTASSGVEALSICARERIDVVLLDVMMPGMDGFEVCKRLKSDPKTHHIPVVMVTALDQASDRIQGLKFGADDFLTKPVDDIALITRVKNLARLKNLNDEMVMRAATSFELGVEGYEALEQAMSGVNGRVLVVDDHPRNGPRLVSLLEGTHKVICEKDVATALDMASREPFDVIIISLAMKNADGLRLCSQIRSQDLSRHVPIIVIVEEPNEARLLRGFDMGVNDYLVRPIEPHELFARVSTQIKRKRHLDFLRNRLAESVEQSITDPLTGLYNRRYMESHLRTLVEDAGKIGRKLSVLWADIDFFKNVNDTYGHEAGDRVLKQFSDRILRNTRGIDLACRMGGEEFLLILPDTDELRAYKIGERLRTSVAAGEFEIAPGQFIRVTASVGLSTFYGDGDTPEKLLKRADEAMYCAKRRGRNRVSVEAA